MWRFLAVLRGTAMTRALRASFKSHTTDCRLSTFQWVTLQRDHFREVRLDTSLPFEYERWRVKKVRASNVVMSGRLRAGAFLSLAGKCGNYKTLLGLLEATRTNQFLAAICFYNVCHANERSEHPLLISAPLLSPSSLTVPGFPLFRPLEVNFNQGLNKTNKSWSEGHSKLSIYCPAMFWGCYQASLPKN